MIRGGMRVMIRPDTRSNRPAIEIADILRRHGDTYRRVHAGHLGRVERRVMSAIVACRTEALGGHMEACDDCGTTRVAYNSCRNRHCPKCQGPARAAWLAAREADLLPVPYFHVVFTLPAPIAAIAFQNKATFMRSCSKPPPRQCRRSPPIRAGSAPGSASSPSSTPGGRR
jgi:hypothetical protein